MLNDIVTSDNPLVKYGFGAFIVFAPLYLLQSWGYDWPFRVAVIAFIGLLGYQVGRDKKVF